MLNVHDYVKILNLCDLCLGRR